MHSEEAIDNLRREGIADDRIHFVGNTMIDTLVALRHRFDPEAAAERIGVRQGEYLLVTLHRPALVDGPLLDDAVRSLAAIAEHLPVVFPVHPRTRRRLAGRTIGPGINLTEPLGYIDFLSLESGAAGVLTDSGGVQEETTFLGVPCFTLRDNTERPVTVTCGTNVVLGLAPERIREVLPALLGPRPPRLDPPPLWDGMAARRTVDVLLARQRPTVCPRADGSRARDG